MNIESADALSEMESDTARWKALLNDPEFMDVLLLGVPKRPDGWWQNLPECPVLAMFELFPLARPH
jgi:hypothetical protein